VYESPRPTLLTCEDSFHSVTCVTMEKLAGWEAVLLFRRRLSSRLRLCLLGECTGKACGQVSIPGEVGGCGLHAAVRENNRSDEQMPRACKIQQRYEVSPAGASRTQAQAAALASQVFTLRSVWCPHS
jgi:hypothetical protein